MKCSNCASSLRFDPDKGKLVCGSCGGEFDVVHRNDQGLVDITEVVSSKDEITREDVNVYTCSTCGGSIVVNDVEMTSDCPFCGNHGVIFDRVANRRRPDGIIPFAFGVKTAEEKARAHLKGSMFLNRKAKQMPFVRTVGIYIPYYIVQAESNSNLVYEKTLRDKKGNIVDSKQIGRATHCYIDQLLLEASASLSNAAGLMIEPFDIMKILPFEEGYLQGFCSDMADEDPEGLLTQATKRIRDYELSKINGSNIAPYGYVNIAYDNDTRYKGKSFYALFPVWFVVGRYKDKDIIMLVNGQTGKVVGGPEYNKAMFASASLGVALLPIIVLSALGAVGFGAGMAMLSTSPQTSLTIGFALISLGSLIVAKQEKVQGDVRRIVDLSSSRRLIKFVARRKK